MSAKLLSQAGSPEWVEPVAETLYLLALELGANEERIARAEAERDSAQALPELPGPSVLAQVQTLREERDNLRRRAQALEQVVAAKEKELKEKEQELERIRKTLKG
jgi:predicted  nucleic acid-binding Zn-ribbon protein